MARIVNTNNISTRVKARRLPEAAGPVFVKVFMP
jgi:hypothetical protein